MPCGRSTAAGSVSRSNHLAVTLPAPSEPTPAAAYQDSRYASEAVITLKTAISGITRPRRRNLTYTRGGAAWDRCVQGGPVARGGRVVSALRYVAARRWPR